MTRVQVRIVGLRLLNRARSRCPAHTSVVLVTNGIRAAIYAADLALLVVALILCLLCDFPNRQSDRYYLSPIANDY